MDDDQKPFDYGHNDFRTLSESRKWALQRTEKAIDPDLPIIDAHHHFWDRPGGQYLLDHLLEDARSGHNIRASVYVECGSSYRTSGPEAMRPLGETEFVIDIAEKAKSRSDIGDIQVAAGIVAFADLLLGDSLERVLEEHVRLGQGRMRGIRHRLAWDAHGVGMHGKTHPPEIALDPQFRRGYAKLAKFDLTFDAWQYYFQLPEIANLAAAFPETTIVVNHVGGPLGVRYYADRRKEVFQDWRRHMADLSRLQNVVVKVGGLGMLTYGFGFHQRDVPANSPEIASAWRPLVETCVELFGSDRCMFESNFPVDQQSCSYVSLWNAFKLITRNWSADDRANLFSRTASRIYKLPAD